MKVLTSLILILLTATAMFPFAKDLCRGVTVDKLLKKAVANTILKKTMMDIEIALGRLRYMQRNGNYGITERALYWRYLNYYKTLANPRLFEIERDRYAEEIKIIKLIDGREIDRKEWSNGALKTDYCIALVLIPPSPVDYLLIENIRNIKDKKATVEYTSTIKIYKGVTFEVRMKSITFMPN